MRTFEKIRTWGTVKGLYKHGDPKTQSIKLMEEVGELAVSILKNDIDKFKDAVGDIVVVLTNLAAMQQIRIEDCIELAYDEIKDRKGKMENGTFMKEAKDE